MINLGGLEWIFKCLGVAFLLTLIGVRFGFGIGRRGPDENQEVIDKLNPLIQAAQDETLRNLVSPVKSYKAQEALDAFRRQYVYDGQYYKWRR
jgi:hypothetical protein